MLRKFLAIGVAILILLTPHAVTAAPQDSARVQLRSIRAGSRLEAKLKNGDKLRGTLGSIYDDGFEIQVAKAGPVRIAFADVQSVRLKTGMSAGAKIGGAIGIFGAVAILVTYLVLSAIGSNG